MLVSFNLICQNEEFFIKQCLNYIYKLMNKISGPSEVIIIDGGSTDNTLNIIKNYTDPRFKLFHFPWQNNFSYSRNFAISKSSGHWIFYLDIDEILSDNIFIRINNLLNAGSNVKAYTFPKLHLINDLNHVVNFIDFDPGVRVFRNLKEFEWKGTLENLYYKDTAIIQHPSHFNFPWLAYRNDIYLMHFAHLKPKQQLIDKFMKRALVDGSQFCGMTKEQIEAVVNDLEHNVGPGIRNLNSDITFYSEM